jgi:hypothetical protein
MAVGREQRMAELAPRIEREFGATVAPNVIEVLTLTEFAWHDCYGEPSPPHDVIDDIFVVAGGDLAKLISAASLAVIDRRDLRVTADGLRRRS